MPSSCEIGSCKSCMLRLLHGDCHQTASTAQEDTILPCTSYARSTLHLARIPKDGEE
ncbi:2Fe-2S iron-sulfur cluster-binding protein [Sulfitobacter pacificus]|uniref:2Fe-2S iron-sulfur cluster-binding protein n=1 Tax=Sulfitobacter pacificus TaxID=1499314 RepID=UPI003622B1E1